MTTQLQLIIIIIVIIIIIIIIFYLHIMTTSFISVCLPVPNNFRTLLASYLSIQFPSRLLSIFTILFPFSAFTSLYNTHTLLHTFLRLYLVFVRHHHLLLSASMFLTYQFCPRNNKACTLQPLFCL